MLCAQGAGTFPWWWCSMDCWSCWLWCSRRVCEGGAASLRALTLQMRCRCLPLAWWKFLRPPRPRPPLPPPGTLSGACSADRAWPWWWWWREEECCPPCALLPRPPWPWKPRLPAPPLCSLWWWCARLGLGGGMVVVVVGPAGGAGGAAEGGAGIGGAALNAWVNAAGADEKKPMECHCWAVGAAGGAGGAGGKGAAE